MLAFSANDCLPITDVFGYVESKPMIPQDGQIQIRDVSAVRWIRKNVIHTSRLQMLIQRCRIMRKHREVLPAVKLGGIFRPQLSIVRDLHNLLLSREHVQISAMKCFPYREFDTARSEFVSINAKDAGAPATFGAPLCREKSLIQFCYRCRPCEQEGILQDSSSVFFYCA